MQTPTVAKDTLLNISGVQMRVSRVVHDGVVVAHQGGEVHIGQKAVEEICDANR